MNSPSLVRGLQVLLLGLAWIACTGCASFSEGELPKRSLSDYEGDRRLAAITYEFSDSGVLSTDEALVVTTPAPVAQPSVLKSRLEPIFRRVFLEATRQKEPGEWHVDMYSRETEKNPAVTYTLALFFVASLGLIPAYSQTELYFEAKLKHDGATVRQYVYEESITTWLHWFVLPWSFSYDPMERKSALIDNMVLNLVHDLRGDLPRGSAAQGSSR